MKDVIYLPLHLLTTIAKLIQPGGSRAVIVEHLLLKQQLIIHSRIRQRAPNLTVQDRTLLGFLSLFLNPRRQIRSAVILTPSTLLSFHNALKKRKYHLLDSPRGGRKPGPKGPSKEVINAFVEMKQRNPRYGCPRIIQQISPSSGLRLAWKTSSGITSATTMNIDAIPVRTAPFRSLQTTKWLISTATDGRSIVAVYFSYQWRPEVGIRQGHVFHQFRLRDYFLDDQLFSTPR